MGLCFDVVLEHPIPHRITPPHHRTTPSLRLFLLDFAVHTDSIPPSKRGGKVSRMQRGFFATAFEGIPFEKFPHMLFLPPEKINRFWANCFVLHINVRLPRLMKEMPY